MDSDYEKRLETQIDAVLKALPELSASRAFSRRVLTAIEARAALPWYRQSWQAWPSIAQAMALGVLLALFAGLCLGSWELMHGATFAAAVQRATGFFAPVGALWSAVSALMAATVLLVKSVGTTWLIAGAAALALGYGACLGLGSVCVRLAVARR